MSTYWGYRCPGHNVSSEHALNRGDDVLAEWYNHAPALAEVNRLAHPLRLTTYVDGGDDVLEFLFEHVLCHLELENEYGERIALMPWWARIIVD